MIKKIIIAAGLSVICMQLLGFSATTIQASAKASVTIVQNPIYQHNLQGYITKTVGTKVTKTKQKFKVAAITDSRYILALGLNDFLYSIDKANLEVMQVSSGKVPDPKHYYITYRNGNYYYLDASNRSALFYYGSTYNQQANLYAMREFANLDADDPKGLGADNIIPKFSALGDYILYNRKEDNKNTRTYMYDTATHKEFLIANNTNMRLVFANADTIVTCEKLIDKTCILRLFRPNATEVSHLIVPELIGLTSNEISLNGVISSKEFILKTSKEFSSTLNAEAIYAKIKFKKCTAGIYGSRLLMLSNGEQGLSVETKDRKYVLRIDESRYKGADAVLIEGSVRDYIDKQGILIKNIFHITGGSIASEMGYVDKLTNKYTKVYSGMCYSIIGIDSNHNIYFNDTSGLDGKYGYEKFYAYNENDNTVECLKMTNTNPDDMYFTVFTDNRITMAK